jgi:hypothetical protein
MAPRNRPDLTPEGICPVSKPRGSCAFCGGQTGLTKGHIWPDCFGKILPSDAKYHEQKIGLFNTFDSTIPGPDKWERVGTGPLQKRRPRNTCKTCNSGWMSRMETAAIPIVSPLILAEPFVLNTSAMKLLAAVLALVSVRVELTAKFMRAVPQSEIQHLMHNAQPSENWRIWIARHVGADLKDYLYRYSAMQIVSEPTAASGPEHCNTQVTTLVVGQLYAHILFSTVWPNFEGYEGVGLTRIWPPNELHIRTENLPAMPEQKGVALHETIARMGKSGAL